MKKLCIGWIVLFILSGPVYATSEVAGATWPEQIVQEMSLVQQYTTQAQQLQQQFQMVSNQALNLQSIPVQLWPNISGQLNNLVNLVGNAQGLSYASSNTLAQVSAQYGSTSQIMPGYDTALQNWTSNLNSQIAAVLAQYGLQANDFQSTQQALASIQNSSNNAPGRMQVLQAGNQISGLLVNQMQGLQSTIMAGNQAELNYIDNKANQEQQDRNNAANFIQGAKGHY